MDSVHETVSKDQTDTNEKHRRALRTAFNPVDKLEHENQASINEKHAKVPQYRRARPPRPRSRSRSSDRSPTFEWMDKLIPQFNMSNSPANGNQIGKG